MSLDFTRMRAVHSSAVSRGVENGAPERFEPLTPDCSIFWAHTVHFRLRAMAYYYDVSHCFQLLLCGPGVI